MADHASRDFATGGAGGVAAAVEQLYQPGKDTSLAATIRVPELFRQAQLITSRTLEVFTMYWRLRSSTGLWRLCYRRCRTILRINLIAVRGNPNECH